nr:hypothetical protein NG677_23035 [Methylobacterium sp. OTU13CASTA1]
MAHLTDLWLARRGRRAALRIVRPYVERTRWRRGSDPGEAWMEPYALGFLTCLVTLVARPVMGGVPGEVLGLVQAEAWAALTGLPAGPVGERVLTLSLAQDPDFTLGMGDALLFHSAHRGSHQSWTPDGLSEQTGAQTVLDLWDSLIGVRIEAGPLRATAP